MAAQAALPAVLGVPVRVPFDTPFVRSSLEIASELRVSNPDVFMLVCLRICSITKCRTGPR